MKGFSKESLDTLRNRVDVVEVISSHITLSRRGIYYKGCCPFHNEKSPSFTVKHGDTHYHCYGCGEHGDAISFLTKHLGLTFNDAVVSLAEKYNVTLTAATKEDTEKSLQQQNVKEALMLFTRLFHYILLETEKGKQAYSYLLQRGISDEMINRFMIGYAPDDPSLYLQIAKKEKIKKETLEEAGLMRNGKVMFRDRIAIPLHHSTGYVAGFSCRSFKKEAYGPKYINSPDTIVFKKSDVVFGLHIARQSAVKTKHMILVEGQFDAITLIEKGFTSTVAFGGTAANARSVNILVKLGIKKVYIAFDGDSAGEVAAIKVGQLFQKEAIEVFVVRFTDTEDPDGFVQKNGANAFEKKLHDSQEYLRFLIDHCISKGNISTPAGKNNIVNVVTKYIHEWEHPLMVHEGLKLLSTVLHIPKDILSIPESHTVYASKKAIQSHGLHVNHNKVIEIDVLRWLFLSSQVDYPVYTAICKNLKSEDFSHPDTRRVFEQYLLLKNDNHDMDIPTLKQVMNSDGESDIFSLIEAKKVNFQKAEQGVKDAVLSVKQRNWLFEREEIKNAIQSSNKSEEEVLALAKQFDDLRKTPPAFISIEH